MSDVFMCTILKCVLVGCEEGENIENNIAGEANHNYIKKDDVPQYNMVRVIGNLCKASFQAYQ